MIGFGSNRLTIARRGGMSVTQAGRGGMEWLAGGRVPSWASPYSAQATAALKAQFPTQWPTIRDYGFAHPEIVGYMNAYAPEDAKIAYSLVAGLGTRYLYGAGNVYVNAGVLTKDFSIFEMGMKVANTSQFANVEGTRETGNTAYSWCRFSGGKIEPWYGFAVGNVNIPSNVKFLFTMLAKNGEQKGYIDGELKYSNTSSLSYVGGSGLHYFFAMNNTMSGEGSPANYYTGYAYEVAYKKDDGTYVKRFVPFKRNGEFEWLDLVTGTLGDRHGTFTELIESPS